MKRDAARLWADDANPAPAGWARARTVAELRRALRGGRVAEVSLGGSEAFIQAGAEAIEQSAFTGRSRCGRAVVRATAGPLREMAERCLANAERHWAALPPPPPPPPPPGPGWRFLRFLFWHAVGFVLAGGGYVAWWLIVKGQQPPIVRRLLGAD